MSARRRILTLAVVGVAAVLVGVGLFRPAGRSIAAGGTGPRLGQAAPLFESTDLTGQPVALADFRGRPVLMNFWASWCGPCRMAAPHVVQTARDLAGRAVVLKVDTERFPGLASQYNVRSIPNFAVFSRGQLQFQQAGLVDAITMESWLTRAA